MNQPDGGKEGAFINRPGARAQESGDAQGKLEAEPRDRSSNGQNLAASEAQLDWRQVTCRNLPCFGVQLAFGVPPRSRKR
jgi:hypothetical protein